MKLVNHNDKSDKTECRIGGLGWTLGQHTSQSTESFAPFLLKPDHGVGKNASPLQKSMYGWRK